MTWKYHSYTLLWFHDTAFICKKCESNDDCKEGYDCKNQECIWGKEAIECYGCGYNKNCKSIDEFDEKWQCLSGWEKCQIVTHHILGKDVYVNGGCEPGPPLKEDKCERREVSITGNSKNATVCTCSKHLCNGPDYGCGSKWWTMAQKIFPTSQRPTTTTQKTTTTTEKQPRQQKKQMVLKIFLLKCGRKLSWNI